jgi:hypothetical protein
MAFAYNVALNVAPPKGKADVKLVTIEGGKTIKLKDETKDAVAFVVENTGNQYAYLQDFHIEITKPDGKKVLLEERALKRGKETPLLPAGMKRSFLLPVDEKFPAGKLNARLY